MAYAILRITTGEIYTVWPYNKMGYYPTKQHAQDVINILAQLDDKVYSEDIKNNFGYGLIIDRYKRSKAEYEIIEV